MELEHAIRETQRRLTLMTSAQELANAAQAEPALAPFQNCEALVSFLEDRSPGRCRARDRMTRALLSLYQEGTHAVALQILFIAYAPFILRLCRELGSTDCNDAAGRRALVVEAFFEAAARMPTNVEGAATALSLALKARQCAMRALEREARTRSLEVPLTEDLHELPGGVADPEGAIVCREVSAAIDAILATAAEGGVLASTSDDSAAIGGRGRLRARLRECFPTESDSHIRKMYQRLRARRSRSLRAMRASLADTWSQIREDLDFLDREGWQ